MKDWVQYQNQDYVMQFLMGLNESYAQIRAQVLMMDPIPVISKVFSLVVQEERQRSIHSDTSGLSLDHSSPNPSIAIVKGPSYGKNDKGRKSDLPTCSHCHYPGHTSDKCYQLHGYPPSHPKYKPKQYSVSTSNASKVRANHLKVADTPANSQSTSSAPDSLSPDQCKQLLAFLSTQLQLGYGTTMDSKHLEESASCLSGYHQGNEDWDG
ncbi:uncharacterized protein [Primulina huaijiensis]|uniref:uncharacterized protein n=1 Tax=Primulina huaijiensis TaxID=1492673 RepID=UPI003CC73212